MSTYTPVATQTLDSNTATVTFSSVPQHYTDLILVIQASTTHTDQGARLYVQFNSSTSLYSDTWIEGNGSSASSSRDTSDTYLAFAVAGNSSTSFGTYILNIQNYANASTFKTTLSRSSSATANALRSYAGLWRSTNAITDITLRADSSYRAGSTFTLYGITAGNSSAKATGGNIVVTDGSYWYHTFTSSGVFIPSQALTVDYLVVAGGGSGGSYNGSSGSGNGGGGAGGLRSTVTATGGGGSLESALSLSANTAYLAIVGAGGAGISSPANAYTRGNSGTNSIFASITSTGGGGGGAGDTSGGGPLAPLTGGSGGGAGYFGNGAAGTTNQGYAGGNGGNGNPPYYSGGGGGAGGAGGNANGSTSAGVGGAGLAVAISGSSVTYAAGGAGCGWTSGGSSNAALNTGNGSGGAGTAASGSGGSGIIIIRYAV